MVTKSEDTDQKFLVTPRGVETKSDCFVDEEFHKTTSSFTFYGVKGIEVQTVQKVYQANGLYG